MAPEADFVAPSPPAATRPLVFDSQTSQAASASVPVVACIASAKHENMAWNLAMGGVMPGMNSGLNLTIPLIVAAFRSALLHQGLIALLIFGTLAVAWVSVREWLPVSSSAGTRASRAKKGRYG